MVDFFDKVKQGISKGVTTASIRSKEMIEVTKLKSQITTVQDKKESAIEELGNIVYTMVLKESIDEARIKEKGAAILKLDNQIKDLENEIVQVQNKARESLGVAPSIGTCTCGALIYEDTKFCGACGNKVGGSYAAPPQEEVTGEKNVCSQCKSELVSGAKFCNACGSKAL